MSSKKFFKEVDPLWVAVIHFVAYQYGVWAAGSLMASEAHRDGGGIAYFFAIPVWMMGLAVALLILHLLFKLLPSNGHRSVLVAAALTVVLVGHGFPGIVHLVIAAAIAVYVYRLENREVQDEEDLRNFK